MPGKVQRSMNAAAALNGRIVENHHQDLFHDPSALSFSSHC
jgi:hypothetical protein